LSKQRNKYADYMVYLALRLVSMFANMLSVATVYRLAGLAGDAWYALDVRHRRRAVEHLRESFPTWPWRRLEQVARGSFRSVAYLGIESLLTPRQMTSYTWGRRILLPAQTEAVRLLLERASGVIFICGHLGGWEVAGYGLALLGFKGYAVARPLDNPHLNRYLMDSRGRMGLNILDKRGAMDAMDTIFARNDYVGFIADQDAGRTGVFVDFMGRPASTYKAPALMAMRYNVPVVVHSARRVGETYLFEMEFDRVIRPDEWADKADPMRWITQEYTAALERAVRRSPEQYLWIYRRWKTSPRRSRKAGPEGSARAAGGQG
jgi:KDO2-lipid IV(A) lauroyltransferase